MTSVAGYTFLGQGLVHIVYLLPPKVTLDLY